ncbi:hypothetical protein GQ53DRAFT_370788 [Thozetella sp. PMI_491]|nr:hypothetical protein GQ53DRAFT_370788 [Thozetella sp. PMI_491]
MGRTRSPLGSDDAVHANLLVLGTWQQHQRDYGASRAACIPPLSTRLPLVNGTVERGPRREPTKNMPPLRKAHILDILQEQTISLAYKIWVALTEIVKAMAAHQSTTQSTGSLKERKKPFIITRHPGLDGHRSCPNRFRLPLARPLFLSAFVAAGYWSQTFAGVPMSPILPSFLSYRACICASTP